MSSADGPTRVGIRHVLMCACTVLTEADVEVNNLDGTLTHFQIDLLLFWSRGKHVSVPTAASHYFEDFPIVILKPKGQFIGWACLSGQNDVTCEGTDPESSPSSVSAVPHGSRLFDGCLLLARVHETLSPDTCWGAARPRKKVRDPCFELDCQLERFPSWANDALCERFQPRTVAVSCALLCEQVLPAVVLRISNMQSRVDDACEVRDEVIQVCKLCPTTVARVSKHSPRRNSSVDLGLCGAKREAFAFSVFCKSATEVL